MTCVCLHAHARACARVHACTVGICMHAQYASASAKYAKSREDAGYDYLSTLKNDEKHLTVCGHKRVRIRTAVRQFLAPQNNILSTGLLANRQDDGDQNPLS